MVALAAADVLVLDGQLVQYGFGPKRPVHGARMLIPVMPGDEIVDDLPIQVVSNYLWSEVFPPSDGIMYSSVQAGRIYGRNAVLFHRSTMVAKPDLPMGTTVTASLYADMDEGPEEDFSVSRRHRFPLKANRTGMKR